MSASGLVAFVFTDLVDSTELAEAIGGPAADALRRDHFASLRAAVADTGGEEVKTIGDSLMVTYRTATEAITGAVALQQAADRHDRSVGGSRLLMRVGISVGDATAEDGDWFGRPVVEAARLCAAAEGGQILAADLVRVLAGNRSEQVFAPLGERALKGLPEPLAVCEVAWEPTPDTSEQPPPPDAIGRATTSALGFVGRHDEFDALVGVWKDVTRGERRLVLVTGEPGIGKTRLVAELAGLAHDQGGIVLWGSCDEDLGVSYQPLADALGQYAHSVPTDSLRAALGSLGGELSRLVPDLPSLVPGLEPTMVGDLETDRHRLFAATSDLLATLGEDRPVLLVLDDLHWAAKPTLLLLRHLLRAPRPGPLLVVGTYRDTDLDRRHPLSEMLADLRRSGEVDRVLLGGLGEDGVEALMESAAGHNLDQRGRALAEAVHRETEGNPFFVREVLLHLVESGALVQRDGRWTSDVRPDQMGIPEGVREVIGRRLSRLPEPTNELLAAASVIGREFELGLLAVLHDGDREAVLAALEPAERANLVRAGSRGGSYVFAHALVRSTLYEELPTSRRLRLHRDAGVALEGRGGVEDHLADLARHFGEAAALGETGRAVDYARRAGERAAANLAFEEAVAHYERGLGALDVADADDPATRCDLLLALGTAQTHAADARDRATLLAAAGIAEELGDVDRRADAAMAMGYLARARNEPGFVDHERIALLESCVAAIGEGDTTRRARLLGELVMAHTWLPDDEGRMRRLGEEALAMARRLDDPATLAEVLNRRFTVTEFSDPAFTQRRMAELGELIDLADGTNEGLSCSGRLQRAPLHFMRGDRYLAETDLEAARQLAERLREPGLIHRLATIEVAVTLLSGRLAEAEEQIVANIAYAEAHDLEWPTSTGSHYYRLRYEQGRLDELLGMLQERVGAAGSLPAWRLALASAYVQLDRLDEARPLVRELAADGFAMVAGDAGWSWEVAGTARVAALAGERDVAASAYDLALPHAGLLAWTGTSFEQPIDLSLGTAAGGLGRVDEAEHHFADAIALSERAGAPTFVAVSRLHWALMLAERGAGGDEERARELAGQALATAEELGLGRIERVATTLLV